MTYHATFILGHVGKEPEMRYTPSGKALTNFSVAVNEDFTTAGGERQSRTVWYRISTWDKLAELCRQYVHKGNLVLVEGRLTADENGGPRIWTGNDGKPRASFEVNASVVRFLSKRDAEESEPERPAEDGEAPF